MLISQVAKKYHLTISNLHYWENIGLLTNVHRNANGYRDYDQKNIGQLEFVICMRNAGVNVNHLAKYMQLFQQGNQTMDQRKQILIDQLHEMDRKMDRMKSAHQLLSYKIKHYDQLGRVDYVDEKNQSKSKIKG
ncbi:transcriptional regulator [Philodulcilactobacillus myokoensis]|uniref:Transcriptional regulator n=1 Tax=Philodulcilactobacillus myokoensis TaxID=2929573 RepID=A0A9W6ESS9_9LACO|nr:MerR family transcriptional regulator [Philodulcilactobacillus myokoensis]GLB47361.1 transcriptional regulator [Philodulcilactobacillus myokoensis]